MYTWRKELVRRREEQGLPVQAAVKQQAPAFMSLVIAPEVSPEPAHAPRRSRRRHRAEAAQIELETGDALVRISSGADPSACSPTRPPPLFWIPGES